MTSPFTWYASDPMTTALRGMNLQMELLRIQSDNLMFSDIPGYQKKEPVITKFAEYLGKRGVDEVLNTEVGRLLNNKRPLDIALATKGYFQKQRPDGQIEITRDGRMRIDAKGMLTSIEGFPILSVTGEPIQFKVVPKDWNNIKIEPNGTIRIIDKKGFNTFEVDRIGVVQQKGKLAEQVDIRQGFIEASNVLGFDVIAQMVPIRRTFQANRQMFVNHNQLITRLVQELGRAQ